MASGSESFTSRHAHPSLAGSLVDAVLDRAMTLAASTDVAPSTVVLSLHQLANDDPQVLREALALAEQCLTGSDPSGVGATATSLLRFSLDRHLWTQRVDRLPRSPRAVVTKPDRHEVSTIGTPGVAPDVAQIIQLLTGAEMALAQQWTDSLEDMDAALTDRWESACNHVRRALAALSRDSLG